MGTQNLIPNSGQTRAVNFTVNVLSIVNSHNKKALTWTDTNLRDRGYQGVYEKYQIGLFSNLFDNMAIVASLNTQNNAYIALWVISL